MTVKQQTDQAAVLIAYIERLPAGSVWRDVAKQRLILITPVESPVVTPRKNSNWTKADIRYLMSNYQCMRIKKLAAYLGRTPKSCYDKYYTLQGKKICKMKSPLLGSVSHSYKYEVKFQTI